MIPLKLELKNFLSYGEAVEQVDFKDYSLICLSGKNGNGKSAILDAITWAIWGQARKISGTVKPDAGLMRLGQTRMFVSLEFEFSQNIYRVRREFAKTYGKPYFALDFELFDKIAQKFIALTDKTVRQTQLKIDSLLGLDFDTFVNSAFLRQGAADEFSKKTPKERKQILANILGFSKYDELQNLASEQTKVFQEERKLNDKLQEQMFEQIKKETEYSNLLDEQKKLLDKINLDFATLENDLGGLQKEKDALTKQKQNYDFVLEDRKKVQQKCDFKLKEFEKIVQTWKQIHYKSLHLPDIKIIEQEKALLLTRERGFLELQKKSLFLQEQLLQKKDLYQKEERRFREKKEKELYDKRFLIEKNDFEFKQILVFVEQQEKLKAQLELKIVGYKKELAAIFDGLKKNLVQYADFERARTQFEKRKSFYQSLIQKGNWVKAELKELDHKIKTVNEHSSPSCPLCEQVLSVKRKSFLGSKFQKDSTFLNYRLDRLTLLIKKLKDILFLQHEQIKLLEQKVELEKVLAKDEQDFNAIFQSIEKLKKDGNKLSEKIDSEKKDLNQKESAFEVELKNDSQIKDLLVDLEKLEKEKIGLSYDKTAHDVLQKKLGELEKQLKDLELFRQELVEQKERRNKIQFLTVELKELKQLVLQIDLKLKELNFDFKVEQNLDQKVSDLKKQINEKSAEKDKVLHKVGSVESELKRILELKEQIEKKKLRLIFLDEQTEEFKLLSQALGKDGIQALLIEQAIPQIEEEANNILSRLTDNQAQIFIESLRDLKSGGVKETLDIQISDSAGIRPYEMFSGGEAFRVDFALRIAISKLLAYRAGTALQTLIVDEGFGSQDEEGLNRVMDAIYAIQKDFSKIIVVSHLASFKDNFPVHFVVEKGLTGSFVRIEERG
jgi:DNA repair protein SbcC/Rad50